MKPYKIFNNEILDKGKGSVNRTFIRFIGTADSIFSLLLRAYGNRHAEDLTKMDYEFVIIDKNLKHIEMCKEILSWDGYINVPTDGRPTSRHDFDMFASILINAGKKHDVSIGDFLTKKDINTTLGKMTRYQFNNFFEAWNRFRKSKFTFMNIDVINDNGRFCHELMYLKDVERINNKQSIQFVKLDFNKNNYDPVAYKESFNNILNVLWLKSFKQQQSVVELADDNNVPFEDYAGKLYAQFNPTFCILPWMHVQYKPTGQSKPCCRYDNTKEYRDFDERSKNPDIQYEDNLSELFVDRSKNLVIQKSSIEETFSSKYWEKARELTIENKPLSGCHKCYAEEQVPGEVAVSMRLGSNIMYNNGYLHKKPKFEKPSLEFLEVGFGNYCNLACLSCNSSLSTTWHDNEVALNEIASPSIKRTVFPKLDNIQFNLQGETLQTLKLIKFTGGEPMINPEFIKFIDLICEKGHPENISLEIYTNCSYIPSPKLLENLAKFKHIQLNLSIDAFGSVNDYVRFGSKWSGDNKQTVSRAIDFWLEQGLKNNGLYIIMSTTLSILNIFEIPKLMAWWMKKFKDSGNKIVVHRTNVLPDEYDGFFKLQVAFDPSYINVDILPKEYYEDVINWCTEYEKNFTTEYPEFESVPESINASINKLKNTVKRSNGDPKNARNLLEYLEKMDKIRNNSAEESIPEVVNKLKEYLLTQDKPQ